MNIAIGVSAPGLGTVVDLAIASPSAGWLPNSRRA